MYHGGRMRKIVLMIMLLCSTGHVQAVPKSEEMMRLDRTITNLTLEAEHGPRLKSQIALVYDRKTKKPVYTKNIDKQVPIASITKLMTAMVVLDARLPLSEKIKITRDDIDTIKGTRSRLSIGTELTRRELLQLALMSSENRAASALARNYPGGTPAAIAAMNKKAVDLGMKKTHFVEATGLSKNNVSTAADLVNMVEAARQYQLIHQYTTMPTREVANHRGRTLRFNNTNPLVKIAR